MISFLNRNVFSPLHARRDGSRQFEHLRFLKQSQYDSPEVIQMRQWLRIRALLQHAYNTVPYYREQFHAIGLHPSDITDWNQFAQIPILTKSLIRGNSESLRSSSYPDIRKLRKKTTSGSTGVSLTVYNDLPSVFWKTACTIRSDEWSGWRFGERSGKVWGNPDFHHDGLKGRIRNWLIERATYLDTLHINDEQIQKFCDTLRRWPVKLLFGHAHSLYLLACYCKKHQIDYIRPNGIISTAMLLHGYQRVLMEEMFGTKVTNRYGCEETSLIASECEEHDGLHFNSDSIYAEILPDRPDSGSLVLTDLTNFAMPLIRYKVGDVVVGTDRKCKCGRGLPMIERVEGREADYVLSPSGKLISGISLTENFATLIKGAAQVQIVQETREFLRIRMVRSEQFGEQTYGDVRNLFTDTFGDEMKYELDLVDAIPQEASGKYRFCISQVASDYMRAMSA